MMLLTMISVGPSLCVEEALIGLLDGGEIVGVVHRQHVPAEAAEPRGHVLAERQVGLAFDRDVVVVVDPAQVRAASNGRRATPLRWHAFHQVAVAALGPDVEVEQLEARLVVAGREPAAGDRHADAVAATLAERAGRRFDAGRVAVLGMARRAAAPLAKVA